MSNPLYSSHPSEREDLLAALALDVNWTFSRRADDLWRRLDAELWERTHNPWAVLQTLSGEKLKRITSDPAFARALDTIVRAKAEEEEAEKWFQKVHRDSPLHCVAYFSMEYMLSEALPIYSGGLGNVAGDQLKAADDLGVPVTAVGLLYTQGYFRQEFDRNGAQQALYPFNDPGQLPVKPVRTEDGDWLRLSVPLPGCDLWVRVWEVKVGRARLLLLDTNDPANYPEYRGITSELYGGGPELRLRQEMVLGVAGWKVLRALKIQPEVCHLNEGHAAFAILERAASYRDETGESLAVALAVTRAGNLFTTHTPVEAGFDRFAPELIRGFHERYWAERLGITFEELMALGRRVPGDANEPFNMANLAIRGSGAVNGVSRLHGAVSRSLFQHLFPRWPVTEVPVSHVTNGIHVPTWQSDGARELFCATCGDQYSTGTSETAAASLRKLPDQAIWAMRTKARQSLVEYVRGRYKRQTAVEGRQAAEVQAAGNVLDGKALTLGFARRFATYKRPNLLLHDENRLRRILGNGERPVQLVIAGKAHPADSYGQTMIRQWNEFIWRSGLFSSIVFLSDYDMLLTERMVGGVDVWVNTPRRPWEASGTSGMKVLANGGLNLSELDGWWVEAASPAVGWSLGDGKEHGDDPAWDAAEANALYDLLEGEIVPEFFARNEAGIPDKFVSRIRESMASLTPEYSASRTVRQYTEMHYLPRAEAYAARAKANNQLGRELVAWQETIDAGWGEISFGPVHAETVDNHLHFDVTVDAGRINADSIRVELFSQPPDASVPEVISMERGIKLAENSFIYSANVSAKRNPSDFTPRVVPYHRAASVPLEARQILWQK